MMAFPFLVQAAVTQERGTPAEDYAALFLRFFRRRAFRLISRAATAFFARADRSSGVKFSHAFAPPSFPPILPCCLKYSNTSSGSFFFDISWLS